MANPGTKRKLIPEELLQTLAMASVQGVPRARLIRDHNLDLTTPTLRELINNYLQMKALIGHNKRANRLLGQKLYQSLFPSWLEPSLHAVQSEPDNWAYSGAFPFGSWTRIKNVNTERLYQTQVAHRTTERTTKAVS
jgi:hypothetical protein